jgi:glucose/arabinose dehydrogenase
MACVVFVASTPVPTLQPVRANTGATVPPGFVDEPYVSGLLSPRTHTWTPDGRMLIVERGSANSNDANFASIRVVKNGTLLSQRAYTRYVCGDGERGFLGLAVDPNFEQNGFLYMYYSAYGPDDTLCKYNTFANGQPGPRNRISRISMTGDVIDPNSELVLIDTIASDTGIHNAGDLVFGEDGYLYASTGDSQLFPSPAQGLNTLNGKILRIKPNPDGSYSTTGNPYDAHQNAQFCGTTLPSSSTGVCKEIFAHGLRNPFRIAITPNSNSLFVGDVGSSKWEEVDEVVAGGNYGYPDREGPCPNNYICTLPQPPTGFDEPIYYYPHINFESDLDAAVIGGTFFTGVITGVAWPQEYLNSYFFGDAVRGFIRRLKFDSATQTWSATSPDFAENAIGIIGLRRGPDGNLYYLTYLSDNVRDSEVRRIRYMPTGNQRPTAQMMVTPSGGSLDTNFVFSAAGSTDGDNNLPLAYIWDFGDGTPVITTTTITTTHVYGAPGPLTATLWVQDSGNPPMTSLPATVRVFPANLPPTATIVLTNSTQAGRTKFYAGDTWRATVANATDDEPLPNDAFTWSVVFHHRSHTHPFLPNMSGASLEFTIPQSGETDPVIWYRVVLHVKDAQGQTATVSRDLFPATVSLGFNTQPNNGRVSVDSAEYVAPVVITRVVGINSVMSTPMTQAIDQKLYRFSTWSQGGAATQVFVVPTNATTYTASLQLIADLTKNRWWLPAVRK